VRQPLIDILRAKEASLRQNLAEARAVVEAKRVAIPVRNRIRILLFLAGSVCTTVGIVVWLFGFSAFALLPGAILLGAYAVLRLHS